MGVMWDSHGKMREGIVNLLMPPAMRRLLPIILALMVGFGLGLAAGRITLPTKEERLVEAYVAAACAKAREKGEWCNAAWHRAWAWGRVLR